MALVDTNKLGAPKLNLLETVRSHEHGLVRARDKVEEAKIDLDTLKIQLSTIIYGAIFKPLNLEADKDYEMEIGFTRPTNGDDPELKIVIIVKVPHDVQVAAKLREYNMEFKLHPRFRTKDQTKIRLVLHEYLNHAEARLPRPLR